MVEPQSVTAHATSGPSGAVDADHQDLDSGIPHPYHLVRPSIWPLMGSLSGGLLAVGALRYLHHNEWMWLIAGFAAVILTMALWWRDVIRESVVEKVHTPGQRTVEQVSKFMNVALTSKIKLLVVKGRDGGIVGIALRGDHELNEVKAAKHPKIASPFQMATQEEVQQAFGCDTGYLGPVNSPIPIIADYAAAEIADFVCGANENDHHVKGANWGRDCAEPETADLRKVVEGDPSPDGQGKLKLLRGIEVGHIFQLGSVYTQAMKATVLDAAGKEIIPESGCYGIGVTRTAAAVIEQCHDANGIIWPDAIAPFRAIICPIGADKSAAVKQAADKLYEDLDAQGIEVLYDDRGQRPGAMFADADLIGIPHRIVIGDKGLANQQFEYKHRRESAARMIPANAEAVLEILRE